MGQRKQSSWNSRLPACSMPGGLLFPFLGFTAAGAFAKGGSQGAWVWGIITAYAALNTGTYAFNRERIQSQATHAANVIRAASGAAAVYGLVRWVNPDIGLL
ncbi:MAG: hypothetical protein HY042_10770, partial [Spirochaetia bacterium]|nr:hypothetical protein [Spirochaetia bacterium]